MTRKKRFLAAALIAGSLSAGAIAAGPFAALAKLERGRWQFKAVGGAEGRGACVTDPLQLVQFNHPGPACSRFTIVDAADRVTIQYQCGQRGYGKTTIVIAEPGRIRLETQGIAADGRPFDASYDGQFIGPCAPPAPVPAPAPQTPR